ncbi:MAG: putative membrane protein [Polaribacter sp.]|jgi:putative membrane protein
MIKENLPLAKKLNIVATIISIVVIGLAGAMRIPTLKIPTDIDFSFLPPTHAGLNTLAAICLFMAFYFIKNKNVAAHQKSIYAALLFSALFLLSYVTYHFTTDETLFCKQGVIRKVYFTILITHIVSAATIFPFILFTFIRAYTGQVAKHRKMARWVFPIWLYVVVTGPIVYFMLKPCYQ